MSECVFCFTPLTGQNRSREHVIPRWLQEERGISDELLSAGFANAGAVQITREMPLDQFLAGHVCKPCNTGWMSVLETHARKPLLDLLAQRVDCAALLPDERLTLAQWAIKTAIACNSVIPEPARVDARFVRQFDKARNDNLGRCAVVAGRLALTHRFGYIQTTQRNHFIIPADNQTVTCRLAFLLDGLAIVVAFADQDLGYTFELVPDVHRPLWPARGHECKPGRAPTFDGSLEDLRRFSDSLDIRYRLDF
jgi:hypothetical protein